MNSKNNKGKKRAIGIILINILVMSVLTVLAITVTFRWLNTYTRHGQYISVPDVTGMTEEEAESTLSTWKLKAEVTDFQYDKDMEPGAVIKQQPVAGAHVKDGRTIYLTLNSGKEPMRVIPDVADNSSLRAAESKLRIEGFRLTDPIRIDGDLDWVYEIRHQGSTVAAGTELPEGSLLTIVVGNGNNVKGAEESDSTMIVEYDFFDDGL